MTLTVTDLFCGAGGSSLGAAAVPGVQVVLAANHWQLAIDTHAANFPTVEHDLANISQADPRRYRRTNLLWASPECTNHSQAKGRRNGADAQPDLFGHVLPDEAAVRSRATMWDVPRFAEHHAYDAVIVENVVDAAQWVMWPAWLHAMTLLGYAHRVVYLNSMHAPAQTAPRAPQSRDRLYVVFWRAGAPAPDLAVRPLAWCAGCDRDVPAVQWWKRPDHPWGRYRAQYRYRCPVCHALVEPYALPAAVAIDWSLPGQRIGDRDKPLRPATVAGIEAGLRRYGRRPFVTMLRSGRPRNSQPCEPLPTLVADGGRPYLVDHQPTRTCTTGETDALVVPVEARDGLRARTSGEPLRTQTARLTDALVVPYYGATSAARPVDRPLPTVTTIDGAGIAFLAALRGGGDRLATRPVDVPLATVTAGGQHHMLVRHNGTRLHGRDGLMCTPVEQPARTITTTGHQSLVGWTHPWAVEDCTFRMLQPAEIQVAMAFHPAYAVLGNRREQVRQLGNAVTPPAAEWLIRAIATALGGAGA